jgi:transcriptional regulator with XRE-family HTH domain
MMWCVTASEWIEALRARHGLSQAQLAYRAGTSQQSISRIERGLVSPSVALLERLAVACGEELVLDARLREVPFDESQLDARVAMAPAERAELSFSWNKLAGELSVAGARARGELS